VIAASVVVGDGVSLAYYFSRFWLTSMTRSKLMTGSLVAVFTALLGSWSSIVVASRNQSSHQLPKGVILPTPPVDPSGEWYCTMPDGKVKWDPFGNVPFGAVSCGWD
jgi:hypothetical protein